jgi:hypothetical protein
MKEKQKSLIELAIDIDNSSQNLDEAEENIKKSYQDIPNEKYKTLLRNTLKKEVVELSEMKRTLSNSFLNKDPVIALTKSFSVLNKVKDPVKKRYLSASIENSIGKNKRLFNNAEKEILTNSQLIIKEIVNPLLEYYMKYKKIDKGDGLLNEARKKILKKDLKDFFEKNIQYFKANSHENALLKAIVEFNSDVLKMDANEFVDIIRICSSFLANKTNNN